MDTFSIEPKGLFSLEEAARFGFGQRQGTDFDGTMRLTFCTDGYHGHADVSLTQSRDGVVHGTFETSGQTSGRDAVIAQVARVLSLDHDATAYQSLGGHDQVLARLLDAAPGLRPPLFYSPYEAALWAVISMRRPRATAEQWRTRLSRAAGAHFAVAGQDAWAVPHPGRIVDIGAAGVADAAGVELARAQRVVGVAEAASAGQLDASVIASLGEEQARAVLQTIPGIGPFYADLILIRASGVTDVLPLNEPRLLGIMGELYEMRRPLTPKEAERRAEAWRPWRTWVAVLVRVAGPRLLDQPHGPNVARAT